jgi:signal transduction histidine kinase
VNRVGSSVRPRTKPTEHGSSTGPEATILTPSPSQQLTNQTAVERVLARLAVGCRLLSAVQLSVSASPGIGRSAHPPLDAALLAGVVLSAVVTSTLMVRAGTPRLPVPVSIDVMLGLLALAAMPWLIGPADVTTWANWAYPITLFTVSIAAVCFRMRTAIVIAGLLTGGYLLEARHLGPELEVSTLAANACSYLLFAAAALLLARLLRRLGRLADEGAEAKAELAALLAGEYAREQVRPLVHAYDNVVAGVTDSRMPEDVRQAYLRDSARLKVRARAFLQGTDAPLLSLAAELEALADHVARPALTVETASWEAELPDSAARALLDAVEEAVLNARKHAHASSVVVLAQGDPSAWTVTVSDDGCGFAPAQLTADPAHGSGHGLRQLRGPHLRGLGIECLIDSSPGSGTTVTLRGPL